MRYDIDIINRCSVLDDDQLSTWVAPLQMQIIRDFYPFWGSDATLHYVASDQQPNPLHVPFWIGDHTDQPNSLGYHDATGSLGELKVFAADDLDSGVQVPVTMSHELLEYLADPTAYLTITVEGELWMVEVCDPVESEALAYDIDGVLVSDFCLPRYFGLSNAHCTDDGRYDFRGQLRGACPTLTPGGYLAYWDGHTWGSKTSFYTNGHVSSRSRRVGRTMRRALSAPQLEG